MPDTPPSKTVPVEVPEDLQQALADLEDAEASDARMSINGVEIDPLRLNGLDQRRIRVATDGYIAGMEDLMNQAAQGSLEAIGALYYVFRLKRDELKPAQAPYSYEDCLAEIDVRSLRSVMDAVE